MEPETELVMARGVVVLKNPAWHESDWSKRMLIEAREIAGKLTEAQFKAAIEAYLLGEARA